MTRFQRSVLVWVLASATVWVGLGWLLLSRADGASVQPAEVVTIGGVLRLVDDEWRIYDNRHASSGLLTATCKGRYLEVRHHRFAQVPFWSADTDEHLLAAEIHAGVSASLDRVRVFFYRRGRAVSCWARPFRDPLSNVWLMGGAVS